MKYPRDLKKGDYIGVTAPSDGLTKLKDFIKLDNVKNNFEKLGYRYIETENVRSSQNGRSADADERAKQFMELWENEDVGAIISATGGDFLNEVIDKLDFEKIKNITPKWFQGYSDNTGLIFLLTTICDIACIHGQNIKHYGMEISHPYLTNSICEIMTGKEITQESQDKYEDPFTETEDENPLSGYNLSKENIWKNLNGEKEITFKGRSIGGNFDVIVNLIGTKYDNIKNYIEKYKSDGIVWFLEVYEMTSPQVYLHLWQMKNAGYFENCNGIIFGRPFMIREDYNMKFEETIKAALIDLNIPIVYDADIGHVSPQMPIVSGAILEIETKNGKGKIKNYFK